MQNPKLAKLNFIDLINYGGEPPMQNAFDDPMECKGFCVDCESKGLLKGTGARLNLMSHGCDSSVYNKILDPMPSASTDIELPIMFLLEMPGGQEQNGAPRDFKGIEKQPPVNHYYWSPNINAWPRSISDLKKIGNMYGPYFAYLMRKHGLQNVYITNITKCNFEPTRVNDATKRPVIENCVANWLIKEIEIFQPEWVFCFGDRAMNCYSKYVRPSKPALEATCLYHPSAIMNRHQALKKTKEEMIAINDQWMSNGLKELLNG